METVQQKKPFFIVGIGRSGTSLLRLMFHSHPNIAIPYESNFITKYYENLFLYGDLNSPSNLKQLVEDILNEPYLKMWDIEYTNEKVLSDLKENSLKGILESIYKQYAAEKGKKRWGDKSGYLDAMHILNKIFPDALFIHIIRDGRDVANSVIKQSFGPNDIIAAAEWWNEYTRLGRRMGAMLGENRYIEVHFEALVTDPEKELVRLSNFIGEEYSPEMLEYHKHSKKAIPKGKEGLHFNVDSAPKTSRTFAWKTNMKDTDIVLFNKYAGEMLHELGYEVPDLKVNELFILLRTFQIFVQRLLKKK